MYAPLGRRVAAAATALTSVLLPVAALACPSCPVGREARAQVLSLDLWSNLAMTALPFAVIAVVCMHAERW